MPYIINKTDGSTLINLADGVVDTTTTSLSLIGRNATNYGELQNENFVSLLENFSNSSAPLYPLLGQMWYDSANKIYKSFNGVTWVSVVSEKTSSQPTNQVYGDLWFNTTTQQLYIKTTDSITPYKLLGPQSPAGFGNTQIKIEHVVDTGSTVHEVIAFYVNDARIAMFNSDTAFAPNVSEPDDANFPTIYRGLTLMSGIGMALGGTAVNALNLGGTLAASFMRNDISNITTGSITIQGSNGLLIGPSLVPESDYFIESNFGVIRSTSNNTGLKFRAKSNGSYVDYIFIDADNNQVQIDNLISANLIANSSLTLQNARTISLSGVVSGSVSFDGSQNVSMTTSFVSPVVSKSGDTMTGALTLPLNGLTVGTNQIKAVNGKVGIGISSPSSTLDINGSIRTSVQSGYATAGSITVDAISSTIHQIELSGPATLSFNNFNAAGQIVRLLIAGTANSITWPVNVKWPYGSTTVNLDNGSQHMALVTLMRPITDNIGDIIIATYVSY